MISLIFKDENGTEIAFVDRYYGINITSIDKGGPLLLRATVPIELISTKIDLLYDVRLFDDLDEIWLGRVRERPRITENGQAANIICEGYQNHMKDTQFKRHYSDTGYPHWSATPPSAPPEGWAFETCQVDKNNRLLLRVPKDIATSADLRSGYYYRACNTDQINRAIYSITFDYETGADYDSTETILRLISYSDDFNNGVIEWSLAGSGVLSDSESIIITASKKALFFLMRFVGANTPNSSNYWGKITNIRVNGLNGFEAGDNYKADDVIKNFLGLSESLSTDVTQISAGTFTIPELVLADSIKPFDALTEVNKYEGYSWGMWDRDSSNLPRLTYEAHDKTTIDYFVSIENVSLALIGESIESQFNEVDVEYQDAATGRTLVENRTATHTLLDALGITRKAKISINTTSQAAAQQAGNTFLEDRAQKQGKGSATVSGTVVDRFGRTIPAYQMRPGRNILFYDLESSPADLITQTSANVLNGINCFRIVQLDGDISRDQARLQLDNQGDNLPVMLSKKGQN